MEGWVKRSLEAWDNKPQDVIKQKERYAKRLARRVSRLLGEDVAPPSVAEDAGRVLKIGDQHITLEFVFRSEWKEALALRWTCPKCKGYFLTPLSTLSDVGEIVYNLQPSKITDDPKQPDHEGCTGNPLA